MSALRSLTGGLSMMVESVRMSVSNIRQNRMRSFLTILGIMIGVTAVIALVTTISAFPRPFPIRSPPWSRAP